MDPITHRHRLIRLGIGESRGETCKRVELWHASTDRAYVLHPTCQKQLALVGIGWSNWEGDVTNSIKHKSWPLDTMACIHEQYREGPQVHVKEMSTLAAV